MEHCTFWALTGLLALGGLRASTSDSRWGVLTEMNVEMHATSAFSFLRGASVPEELVEQAAELGYRSVALLDRDGLYSAPRFYHAAQGLGLHAIVGAVLGVEHDGVRGTLGFY